MIILLSLFFFFCAFIGEALQGYELRKSAMSAHFKEDTPRTTICSKRLSADDVRQFEHAVREQYWYQVFIDDLPVFGMVGEQLPAAGGSGDDAAPQLFLYTHKKFTITYNSDRVIEVNLTSENPVPITDAEETTFTYELHWFPTDVPYELVRRTRKARKTF